eukprot:565473-Pleurochrysis_carterae.AAC.2
MGYAAAATHLFVEDVGGRLGLRVLHRPRLLLRARENGETRIVPTSARARAQAHTLSDIANAGRCGGNVIRTAVDRAPPGLWHA